MSAKDTLSQRKQRVILKGVNLRVNRDVKSRVIQGSVLGPTGYSIDDELQRRSISKCRRDNNDRCRGVKDDFVFVIGNSFDINVKKYSLVIQFSRGPGCVRTPLIDKLFSPSHRSALQRVTFP